MTSSLTHGRAIAEVNTAALAHNFRTISALGGRTIAVVKANAYGHGARIVIPALVAAGCDFFAVASIKEALEARMLAPYADVLILGYTPPVFAPLLAQENLIQTVFSARFAQELSDAARAPVRAHLKIEGGMHRLGIDPTDTQSIRDVWRAPNLRVCGAFTHLPRVATDEAGTRVALEKFSALLHTMPPLFAHAAASCALALEGARFDGVRPGLALYGLSNTLPSLRPALRVFAPVVQIHELRAGTLVGYGDAFRTSRASRIGVLPMGYADGLPRNAQGYTAILANGMHAPIVGHVCMDQCMVDLTDTTAKEGDTVCIIPDFNALAAHSGSIVYETLVGISPRVERRERGV